MLRISGIFAILLTLGHSVLAQERARPVEGLRENDSRQHALVGGTVVGPDGEREADVLIEAGRIVAVGKGIAIPEGARLWEMDGKRIYPGFIEPWWEIKPGGDESGSHWNSRVYPERRTADNYSIEEDAMDVRRGLGFSVVHLVPEKGIVRGEGAIVLLRPGKGGEQVIDMASGQLIDFASGGGGYPSSLMGAIALVRQVHSDSEWYAGALKAHLDAPANNQRPATNPALDAFGKRNRSFWIARDELDFARIGRVSEEFKVQPVVFGNGYEYRLLDDLNGPVVVPLNFPKRPAIEDAQQALDYSLAELQHWELAPSNPSAVAAAGKSFALTGRGLDDLKGGFWKQVRLAVERGLPKGKALAALTTEPAKMLGIEQRCGSVSTGQFANLTIATDDLFEEKDAKIVATWVEGEVFEFPDVIKPDPSGVWQLHWSADAGALSVEIAKGDAPKIKVGENSFKARWRGDRLLLFPPAELLGGKEGTARLSAAYDAEAKTLAGVGVLPGGESFWWDAKRTGDLPKKDDEKKDEKKDDAADEAIAAFAQYPAGAYGRSDLPEQPQNLLVTGATIWTSGPDGNIEQGDLLVQAGKIVSVGKGLTAPEGTMVIDAEGKHVTAGLIDCHSHVAISRGVNEGSHAVTVEVRIGDSLDPTDIALYRQLGGGLTTANLLHGSANPMGGQNQVIKLRWGSDTEGMRFAGAKPGVKFALGENVKQSNWGDSKTTRYPQTRMGVEQIMRDTFIAAREYRAERNLAVQEGRPHRRNLRLDAALEILDRKRIVHIHSYRQDEILMFVRLAQEFEFTVGTFQHVLEGYKVADTIAAIGAGGSTFSDWWAYKFEVKDAIPTNGALMREAGVVMSFNSDDAELACRMNAEAAKAVKYGGVPEQEALKFVTLNPAKQLRIDARVGSLEKGKDADFVIWSGHPLSTYTRAEQTWIDGRRYFELQEDQQLREQSAIERERLVAKILKDSVGDDKEDDKDKDEADGEGKADPPPKRRLHWLPFFQQTCISRERGLYHNGRSEHNCSSGCCAQ